jgi:hypothetical protein
MKWIGQHIYDQISRFRNDVYLEDIPTGTIASGAHLGLDSNNKIVKAVDGGGDLTSIVAGGGLSGTSLTGPIPTLNLDAQHGGINLIHNEALVVGRAAENQIDFATENKIKFKTNNANQVEIIDGAILPITHNDIDLGGEAELFFKDLWLRGNANISGNVSGTWTGAVIPSAKLDTTNITSLGTLTALNVDNININGDTITASGDMALVATGNDITVDTDTLTIESTTASNPQFIIKNTTNDNSGAEIRFIKDKGAAGANADEIGVIKFQMDNDAQEQHYYAHIKGQIANAGAGDGSEGGAVKIAVSSHDGELQNGLVIQDGDAEDEVDVTLGSGAASITTVAGTLTMGSTAALTNAGLVAVANQSNITGVGTLASGNATAIVDAASLTAAGKVELATTDEADTGTDATRAVTPAGLKSHVATRYAYQYISFSLDARNIIQDVWRSPGIYGIAEVSWTNNHGAGQTQAASDAPSAVDIETTISVDYLDQATGIIIPKACKLDGFYGNIRVNSNNPNTIRPVIGFFRAPEPADSNTTDVTATCVAFDSYDTTSGNIRNRFLKLENSGLGTNLAQGDILFPAVGFDATGNDALGDINGAFTLVLKTLIE